MGSPVHPILSVIARVLLVVGLVLLLAFGLPFPHAFASSPPAGDAQAVVQLILVE